MLTFAILNTIFIFSFFLFNRYNKHAKDILILICLSFVCITWSIFLLMDNTRIPIYIEALVLFIQVICFYFITTSNKTRNPLLIHAKQENYWNIDKEHIIKIFNNRSIEKEDRIEVQASNDLLYMPDDYNNHKIITPNTFSYFKQLDSIHKNTIIKNLDEITNYPLYDRIFTKIVFFLEKEKELFLDYNTILKDYDYNLDFFIIHLWDNYSKDFNIGIGQLESLVTDNILEQELINTLDNINLKMIKLKGSYLQYKYTKFKTIKGIN